jgi:hypothetical protein
MLLRERGGTQFNNCSFSDRPLDRLPFSPPYAFPIDIHSSETFSFPDPLLGSSARILASGLFNLMLNHLKHSKISFVHFPGSSSEVLVATYGQTITWWKIVAALRFQSCLIWLHMLSWQKIMTLLNWLPAFLTWQSRQRLRLLHDLPRNIWGTDSIEWPWDRGCWGVGNTPRQLPGNRATLSTATILLCVAPNSANSSVNSFWMKCHFAHHINHHQSAH